MKELLLKYGANAENIETLLTYTENAFEEPFLKNWEKIFCDYEKNGIASALNQHLVKSENAIVFKDESKTTLEIYTSFAGKIPIIFTREEEDFYELLKKIIYKGHTNEDILNMGACFAYGKINRFMILSNKPYSNTHSEFMGLSPEAWQEKSLSIRKFHEITHYYTKKVFGISNNTLHDEIVADFIGIYATFKTFKAAWFIAFLKLDQIETGGRLKIYCKELMEDEIMVLKKLSQKIAKNLEAFSQTKKCHTMPINECVNYLIDLGLFGMSNENFWVS